MPRRSIRDIIAQRDILLMSQNTTVSHAAGLMAEKDYGAVLVEHDGRFVGIFTERDALGAELSQFEEELRSLEQMSEKL